MDRNSVLAKNTLLYFIGNFSSSLLSFFLLPLYTRYLSPEDFGKIDVIFAFTYVLIPFVTMQAAFACYRYLLDSEDINHHKIIITNTLAVFFIGISIFILAFLTTLWFVPIEFGVVIMAFVVLNGLSSLCQTITRGLRKNSLYTGLGVISTAFNLISNLVFIVGLNFKSISLLLAPMCASIAVITLALIKLRLLGYFDIRLVNKEKIKSLLKYSVPLVPDNICWWLLLGFGRVYLNYYDGPQAVGIYAVANKFPATLIAFYGVFSLAWKENAITQYEAKDRDAYYSSVYNRQAIAILCGIIVLLPATRLVIEFLLGESFRSSYQYIPLLFFSAALSMLASFWGSGFESAKKTSGILISTLGAFAANLVVNILLVPWISIYGTVIANIAANAVLYIIRVKRSQQFFIITTDKKKIGVLALIAAVSALLFYIPNVFFQIVFLLMSMAIAAYYNMDTMQKIFRKLREVY